MITVRPYENKQCHWGYMLLCAFCVQMDTAKTGKLPRAINAPHYLPGDTCEMCGRRGEQPHVFLRAGWNNALAILDAAVERIADQQSGHPNLRRTILRTMKTAYSHLLTTGW
jgi:hypothetical protein